jgi:hypothetical protein
MNLIAIALLSLAAFQEPSFTKDDVLKLSKAGIGEEVILAKIEQEKRSLSFTADDLAEMKKAGVSEKVLARLAELTSKPAPSTGTGKGASLRNLSHRAVRVSVNEADRIIDFSTRSGKELPQGGAFNLDAAPGEYSIAIEGWPTTEKVRVPESGSCSLTVRGADTEYIDLQTIVAEDADGRRVVILHNQGKVTRGQMRRPTESYAPAAFCGPDWSCYRYVRNTVLLGAGVGAVIGHQRGHRTRGAWIGAGAGLFIGCWTWR